MVDVKSRLRVENWKVHDNDLFTIERKPVALGVGELAVLFGNCRGSLPPARGGGPYHNANCFFCPCPAAAWTMMAYA